MTPGEFPEIRGYRPPFQRGDIDDYTLDDALVTLDGDGTPDGHGHHRYGSGHGKSEFPQGWDEHDVKEWVDAVIDNPRIYEPTARSINIFGSHRGVEGIVAIRTRYGVIEVSTAFPIDMVFWPHD